MDSDDTRSFNEDRRGRTRFEARIRVNYRHGDTYLFSRTSNVSELGIFLVSDSPLPAGSIIGLEFEIPNAKNPIQVTGRVMWVEYGRNGAEPGMGIQFTDLSKDVQKQIRSLIRTVAYIED